MSATGNIDNGTPAARSRRSDYILIRARPREELRGEGRGKKHVCWRKAGVPYGADALLALAGAGRMQAQRQRPR
jgi:hypothetical protein